MGRRRLEQVPSAVSVTPVVGSQRPRPRPALPRTELPFQMRLSAPPNSAGVMHEAQESRSTARRERVLDIGASWV